MSRDGLDGEHSHYFVDDPALDRSPSTVELVLPDLTVALATDRGVFARERVDPGTRLLLQEDLPVAEDAVLCDLGCGYGPIALTLAHRAPTSTVYAVDVNERARSLCRQNATACGADRVIVAAPDDMPDDVRFDQIWSNPPIRIGKAPLRSLLGSWLTRLTAGGEAFLVVHKHLGADSLASWLADEGRRVDRVRSRRGYRILRVRT